MPLTVSAVVPVHNEEGAAVAVAREIAEAFTVAFRGDGFEIIFIDDASRDDTHARLVAAQSEIPQLRVLRHERNVGKSGAMRTGFFAARSELVITLDGDGQNPAADAARLVHKLAEAPEAVGMVAGQRRNRPGYLVEEVGFAHRQQYPQELAEGWLR